MSALTDSRHGYLLHTTKAFIAEEPTTVIPKRQVRVPKPGGGADFPKLPQTPQVVRFINQDIQTGMAYSSSDDVSRRFTYIMVCLPDADFQINDTWEEDNGEKQYKVESIIPSNGYEMRVHVTCFAKEPDKG